MSSGHSSINEYATTEIMAESTPFGKKYMYGKRYKTQSNVIKLSRILLMGVVPPVDAFTLLLPYPPNAGSAMKQPPRIFAAPSAINSRFALSDIPRSS